MSRFTGDDDEYVVLKGGEGRTLHKVGVVFAVLVAILAVVGIAVHQWYEHQLNPGKPGAVVEVAIPKGATVTGAGSILADHDVITSSTLFRFWVRNRKFAIQAGTYRFRQHSSFSAALAVLQAGPEPPVLAKVTIPEGLTLLQMTARLAKQDPRFTAAAMKAALNDPTIDVPYRPAGVKSMEGLLFPSTYDLGPKDDADSLVSRMADEMQVIGDQIGLADGVQAGADPVPKLSSYQVVIVASLIQAESGNVFESPKIARVIYNRLDDGMALGIDATSRYLSQQTGQPIDFHSSSPYNTRRQKGLPPTPIDEPSQAALEAALHPADGPWTYYVLQSPGHHFFTDSAAAFEQAKKECAAKGLGCD